MRKVTNKQVETLFDNIIEDVVSRIKEKRKPKVPKDLDNEDKIKIALWFIKKMGGAESAQRVFNAAEKALEAMGDSK